MITMSVVKFELKPLKKKKPRRYRTGSKYDPILDAFLEGKDSLVEVSVEGKDANYLRMQLNKRIKARKLGIKVSAVNNVCYLARAQQIEKERE